MNTKMLMLGILLIAGLSFAQPPNWNWMEYSVNRYGCNFNYNGYGYGEADHIGLLSIVEAYDETCRGGCWDSEAMGSAWGNMDTIMWDGLCDYSGCDARPSFTSFRSSMLQYNAEAASFRAMFLAGVREYLAAAGSRTAIVEDLRDARTNNLLCLETAQEEGPCWICGPA